MSLTCVSACPSPQSFTPSGSVYTFSDFPEDAEISQSTVQPSSSS